jgi:hypothetical protein
MKQEIADLTDRTADGCQARMFVTLHACMFDESYLAGASCTLLPPQLPNVLCAADVHAEHHPAA